MLAVPSVRRKGERRQSLGLETRDLSRQWTLTPSTVGAKKRTGESAGASERKQCMMVTGCITGPGGIRNPWR